MVDLHGFVSGEVCDMDTFQKPAWVFASVIMPDVNMVQLSKAMKGRVIPTRKAADFRNYYDLWGQIKQQAEELPCRLLHYKCFSWLACKEGALGC